MKKYIKISPWLIFLFMICWQVLLTFQGFDFADTGFHLTAFRFIFDEPYSVQYSMMFWLSEVTGALWLEILPSGGLFWCRIGWVIFISLSVLIYLRLFRGIIAKNNVFAGMAITLIFILRGGPESLNYDILTVFGSALGVVCLFLGLVKKKYLLLFLSGVIFGINVFFRLSNFTALAFFLAIPFFCFLNKENIRFFLQKSFFWITGFILGIISVVLLIRQCGQLDLFVDNLSFVSKMGADSEASHGVLTLLRSYMSGYINAFIILIIFLVAVYIFLRIDKRFPSLLSGKRKILGLGIVAFFVLVLMLMFGVVFWSKVRYLFIGLMILQGILMIFDKEQSNKIRLLALCGLILLVIAPLGSDSGLEKITYGMWILGPMVLTIFFDDDKLKLFSVSKKTACFKNESNAVFGVFLQRLFRLNIASGQASFLKNILLVMITISSVVYAWQNTYFDVGGRSKKLYSVQHPNLKYIYTTQKRADVVNELIKEAFPLMENDEYLLAFVNIPMVNYLSDKKPFISTSWPRLYYNPYTFQEKLEEALRYRKCYPAIIRQKQNVGACDWPSIPNEHYLEYPEGLSKWAEHGKILNEFIEQNGYRIVWENDMFQLLLR